MDKDYWHQLWQEKATHFDQKQANSHLIQYFRYLKLKKGSKVFVPLCGKSIDMLWLIHQGYQVIGIELNLQACELFFSEYQIPHQRTRSKNFEIFSNNKITLFCGDFFALDKEDLNFPNTVHAIYDRAALIALPLQMRKQYVNKMSELINPHTQGLLITSSYNQDEMPGPPFSVDQDEVQQLFGKKFKVTELFHKTAEQIPAHLRAKGLTQAQEWVFQLESN